MNKPRTLLCVATLFALGQALEASPFTAPKPHGKTFWRARISRVRCGMKRSVVEKILPVHSSPRENESVPGGRYSFYAVDSEWMVKVPYNFHGFIEDSKKNPCGLMHLYENQIVGPIKLIYHNTRK